MAAAQSQANPDAEWIDLLVSHHQSEVEAILRSHNLDETTVERAGRGTCLSALLKLIELVTRK